VSVINPVAAQAAPIGLGLVAVSGDLLDLQVGLGQFSGPVDVYFAIFAPAISPGVLILTPTGFSTSVIAPWISGTTGDLFVVLLQDFPVSPLPAGMYTFYLLVTPAGSLSSYYLWQTSFTVS
ncbi:MAG TPA: hypothetical protein VEI96_08480, partial [Thermodesulfovibrionales bacterium]|nr:hypothetical protein [Thermodesulfovibrionales bacterium]